MRVSDPIELPIVFGWRRPVILLPASVCRAGNETALRYCLAHEWSHVERRNILSWHLVALVQLLFFYQPLFWWLRRQMRLCQDYLADAERCRDRSSKPVPCQTDKVIGVVLDLDVLLLVTVVCPAAAAPVALPSGTALQEVSSSTMSLLS